MDDEDIDAFRHEFFKLRDEVKKLRRKLNLFESGELFVSDAPSRKIIAVTHFQWEGDELKMRLFKTLEDAYESLKI